MEKSYILIVDRNVGNLSQTAETIVGMRVKSIEISAHTVAQKAIDMMKVQKFALIITNVEIPGMSGFELIEKARELGQDCPVIFQASIVSNSLLHRAKEINATCVSSMGTVNELTDPIKKYLKLNN